MLSNNLKIGWRQMLRQKMYSSIKVGGFALGIAASLLITLFIIDEVNFDTQPKNSSRIYRVYESFQDTDHLYKWVWFQAPFAKTIKHDFPEIEKVGRYNPGELFGVGSGQIRRDDQPDNTYEEKITYWDQELLEILETPMVYGDIKTALDEPNEMVITRRKAEKYYPGENPVGKLMVLNNGVNVPFKIGGVIENFPTNSHLDYDFLIGMAEREMWEGESDFWGATNYPTYVLLREGTDPNELALKLKRSVENFMVPFMKGSGSASGVEDWIKKTNFGLQPLSEIHLRSSVDGIESPVVNAGDIRFVWLFGAVALFIVLIACINFINLSTAKSANRAKEVGLRKTVGSYRSQIIRQFLVESMLYSVFSFVAGILLAWAVLPLFNDMAGKSLVFPWQQLWFLPTMVAASIVIGVVAGLYPSFYLSSFKPVDVLKGSFARGNKNAVTRSTLVVFQFTTSVILIIATVVIYRQVSYILNTKIGYDKDQVVMIQGTATLGKQVTEFKDELLNQSTVKSATIGDYLPIKGSKRNGNGFWNEGKREIDRSIGGQFWRVDYDYTKTLGIKIVDGRFFDKDMASDSNAIVINQEMVRQLNLKDPVGKKIFNYRNWNVIGVVEDFHFESLRQKIEPLTMILGGSTNTVSVKLATDDMQGTLTAIEDTWKKFSPNQPLRIAFLDESFARMYDDVKRMGRIFTSFALLAIIVACLGLFALSAFMVEQRGKEISIRLVLGASVKSIFGLLTVNFVKLVLISIAIAIPAAWYLMTEWLKGFNYKTDISWDVFVVAGGIAVLIALTTISYQSVKAGLVKPVNNLRAE